MLFVPKEKARETCRRLRQERLERMDRLTQERQKAYLKAKENDELDKFFAEYENKYADYGS